MDNGAFVHNTHYGTKMERYLDGELHGFCFYHRPDEVRVRYYEHGKLVSADVLDGTRLEYIRG